MTTVEASPIDSAVDQLANATRVLADHQQIVQRLHVRRNELTAQLPAVEAAAMTAAAAVVPDDGSTSRAAHELRALLATTADAIALHEAAVAAGEHTVKLATQEVAIARAKDELQGASESVTQLESALTALIAAHDDIESRIATARQYVHGVGRKLDVVHVAGRRIRHVLLAAKIDVRDFNEGPRLSDSDPDTAAKAIRAAIENPRWDGM